MTLGSVPFITSPISAWFPSPAIDYTESSLDICDFLIQKPNSTFILRVSWNSMIGKKIFHNDFLVVDKSIPARVGKIVIAEIEGEFVCKELQKDLKGSYFLKAHNPLNKDIYMEPEQQLVIWWVVVWKFSKV